MVVKPLKRVLCTLSEECLQLIDCLRGDQSRSAWIEDRLWETLRIQQRSRKERIHKPARRRRGRVSPEA